ncbi:MAG: citramalate synthase [Nakamurella sp.]
MATGSFTSPGTPSGLPLGDSFHVFDTTLRDGGQREGITYSVADKLAVATLLDELGVGFIEGGWPGAVPKDTEFFARAADGELALETATLVAFGATRKPGVKAADDRQVRALLDSRASVVTLVAKSDIRHVERALRTTPAENLAMVADTVALLVAEGRRVFLDCEHFFDGYKFDHDYGLRVAQAAADAGASVIVLCDTNGGMLPNGLGKIVGEVAERTGLRLGIHCQNDTDCAVANTLAAVEAGVTHVQCTANGYGERPGNANLFSVIGNLVTKMDKPVLPEGRLAEMVRVSHAIADLANLVPDAHQPYVGSVAFAHKAGLHASAIKVDPAMYNHIDPAIVGNDMHILITEMAGRASVELKAAELGIDLSARPEVVARVVETVKRREALGWSYEAADASFLLLLRSEVIRADGAGSDDSGPDDSGDGIGEDAASRDSRIGPRAAARPFTIESYRVIVEHNGTGGATSEATVKVLVGGQRVIITAEGNGPVNALDSALRQAIVTQYPQLAGVELSDYKVRILAGSAGTGSVTRVLVTSSDATSDWTTVGVHANVVEASFRALVDALLFAASRENVPV